MKTRLDSELVRRGLARSRDHAADLIESRSVLVTGIPASKPATQVDRGESRLLKLGSCLDWPVVAGSAIWRHHLIAATEKSVATTRVSNVERQATGGSRP